MTIRSKSPNGNGWKAIGVVPVLDGVMASVWGHVDGAHVLSSVESPEGKPEFHVSVTMATGVHGRRIATDEELERVRAAFNMGGADEDNHGEGKARHLWLDVGASKQEPCPCKEDEDRIVEGDRVRFETP